MPQINLLGLAGERNAVGFKSPRPKALQIPRAGEGMLMVGRIVRVIRFQSSFSVTEITG